MDFVKTNIRNNNIRKKYQFNKRNNNNYIYKKKIKNKKGQNRISQKSLGNNSYKSQDEYLLRTIFLNK
jgi:hypothetical protein